MEVLDNQASAITNFEAMRVLQQIKSREGKRPKKDRQHNLNTVVFEGLKYLKSTPAAHQTEESIKTCIEALRPFELTTAETLQLINARPTNQVDIEVMIEESEERLPSEEQVDALITAVTSSLPERFVPKGKKKEEKTIKKEEIEEAMEE
ncbi:hypothetical protein PENTCL1PPCAC_7115 [Pristionchus entomophagus]|uniref:DNA-directed RNA polymerase III subunit RPC9 n=1 Tax=Pristionchus entomophagus TaxID=358040 RepID=A0AAV5SQQ6_9BILA|nr:hypothetical protein PENTCL1PPCAC_7115 [Pristionchus entomophagus]